MYNGLEQAVSLPQVNGKIAGDTVDFVFTADSVHKATNAGTYIAKVSTTLTGADANNYTFTGSQLSWQIATKLWI